MCKNIKSSGNVVFIMCKNIKSSGNVGFRDKKLSYMRKKYVDLVTSYFCLWTRSKKSLCVCFRMRADKGFLATVEILWITDAIPCEDSGCFL